MKSSLIRRNHLRRIKFLWSNVVLRFLSGNSESAAGNRPNFNKTNPRQSIDDFLNFVVVFIFVLLVVVVAAAARINLGDVVVVVGVVGGTVVFGLCLLWAERSQKRSFFTLVVRGRKLFEVNFMSHLTCQAVSLQSRIKVNTEL